MYRIHFTEKDPPLTCEWDGAAWAHAGAIELRHARQEGSSHRPPTALRLLFSADGIAGIFRVEDRYIRCVHTQDMGDIWKDSCVEFFIQPTPETGYFNFEFNCGGSMLGSYITDHQRTPDGFREFARFTLSDCAQVHRSHSLPRCVDPEISEPTTWLLQFLIPFALLEKYTGPIGKVEGQTWLANAYKCGDETSHPHWLSWHPLPEKNFHLPEHFGAVFFSKP